MSACALSACNLGRDYGKKRALDGVCVEVAQGRVVALLGPNGAGKTTFLNILMGLIEPTNGSAFVLGRPARAMSPESRAGLASMGEGHEPPPWATLRWLMSLEASARPAFDRAAGISFWKELNLSPADYYGALSKGQKRWALAGLALASRAKVLLMDEPAEGMDPSARRSLYEHLRLHSNEHDTAAVVATHVIGDIERVADDIVIMKEGRVALYVSLEELREEVREVEISNERAHLLVTAGFEVLGSRTEDVTLAWVRTKQGDGEIASALGAGAVIRPVDLETVYLAITSRGTLQSMEGKGETR